MSNLEQARTPVSRAPNAILEHMRRRIARLGLLVAVVSAALAAVVIVVICACASVR